MRFTITSLLFLALSAAASGQINPNQVGNWQGFMGQPCADTSGSGTAQSCSTTYAFTPASPNCIVYTTTTANSGTALTVNVNSLGAKSVAVASSGGWTTTLVASSSIPANKPVHLCYDGTNWDASGTGYAASGGSGSGLAGVNAKTTSYTAVSGDNNKAIPFNCVSACTLTLPSSVPASPWTVFVMNWSGVVLSVVPTSGSALYSSLGVPLGTGAINPGMGVSIWSDGTNYYVNQGGIITGSNVTPVLVQSNSTGCPTSGNACNLAFTHDVTPGDAMVIEYMHSEGGTQVISDTNGDVFPSPNYTNIAGNFDITQYVVCSAVGGATTILNTGIYSWVAIYEVANVASSSCQDGFNSGTNTATTSPQSTGSITTTEPYDFILVTGATRGGSTSVTFTEANGYTNLITSGVFASTLNYASFYGLKPAAGSLSDTVSYSGESSAVAIYAGIVALKPAVSSNALIEGDVIAVQPLGQLGPLHQGAVGTAMVSNGPGTMPTPQTVLTTSPLSGMTAGQAAIAATGSTVTSSKPLAGTGAAITTGPSSVTNTDCANFNGTTGQIGDSGAPCGTGSGPGTPLFKQYTYVSDSTAANVTSPSITVAAGDTLVVSCRYGTGSVGTASDSQSNSYTAYTAHSNGSTGNQMSCATAGSSGSMTFKCTQASSAAGISLVGMDYSGTACPASELTGNSSSAGPAANTNIVSATFSTAARTVDIFCASVGSVSGYVNSGQFVYGLGITRAMSGATVTTNADQGCMDVLMPTEVANGYAVWQYTAALTGNPYAYNIIGLTY